MKTEKVVLAVVFFLLFTLPFHYIPSEWLILWKDGWGFENTIITEDDIQDIRDEYNKAGFDLQRKREIEEDPLVVKLIDYQVITKTYKHIPR